MKNKLYIISREYFQTFLIVYITLTLAETLHKGVVSNFFNMNMLLAIVLLSGIGMVMTEHAESTQ